MRRVTQVLLVVIGLLLIGLPLLARAANQARVSPRLLVWDRPGMRFGSWQAQTALVIMVIALALALSVADSGWRWSLLVPAAVVAITSVVTWRRRR